MRSILYVQIVPEYPLKLIGLRSEDYFRINNKIAEMFDLNINVYALKVNPFISNDNYKIRRINGMRDLLKDNFVKKASLIHTHIWKYPLGYINRNSILTFHAALQNNFLKKKIVKFGGLTPIFYGYRAIITETFHVLNHIRYMSGYSRLFVISTPIDYSFWREKPKDFSFELNKKENEKIIVTVANYRPVKNIETLIIALKLLLKEKKLKKIKLLIVGASVDKRYDIILKKLVYKLKLQNNVVFTGWLNGIQLRDVFYQSDIFSLPSLSENQGLSVCEAGASGLPLVLSDLYTFREIFKDCALFHKPRNYIELAELIKKLLQDDKLYDQLKRKCITSMKKFDILGYISKLKNVYQMILEGHN